MVQRPESEMLIVVDAQINPTAAEQHNLNRFQVTLSNVRHNLATLEWDTYIEMHGLRVDAATLLHLANTVDFVINVTGTVYGSGPDASTNSAATWHNGNPVIAINYNVVMDFANNTPGDEGLVFLVTHEIGHLVNGANYTGELFSNDFARAFAAHFGMPFYDVNLPPNLLPSPGFSTHLYSFVNPPPTGGEGGRGDGGGGGRASYA